jgi:hypothetical protein
MVTGWHVNGANTTGETAFAGARRIDMAGWRSVDELPNGIVAVSGILPEPQKDIIMPIENALHAFFLAE